MKKFGMFVLFGVFALISVACRKNNDENWKVSGCSDVKEAIADYFSVKEYPAHYIFRAEGEMCDGDTAMQKLQCVQKIEIKACRGIDYSTETRVKMVLEKWASFLAKDEYDRLARPEPEIETADCGKCGKCCKSAERILPGEITYGKFKRIDNALADLKKRLKAQFGFDLAGAGISEAPFLRLARAHKEKQKQRLLNNLILYPAKPAAESPNVYVMMLKEADPQMPHDVQRAIEKYASEAYARLAEQALIELRTGIYAFPESYERTERMRGYVAAGRISLADIGTTDAELKKLERRYPTLKK